MSNGWVYLVPFPIRVRDRLRLVWRLLTARKPIGDEHLTKVDVNQVGRVEDVRYVEGKK